MGKAHIHLDGSVVVTMLAFIILGIGLLSFRIVTDKESCTEVSFTLSDNKIEVNQSFYVQDKTEKASSWKWNFGDEKGKSTSPALSYRYDTPGTYNIKLIVNEECVGVKTIEVIEPIVEIEPDLFPIIFIEKDSIVQGEDIVFTAQVPEDAETWEWRFGENDEVDTTSNSVTYVFKERGPKTISLIINGRTKYAATRKVFIQPKLESEDSNSEILLPKIPIPRIPDKPLVVPEKKEETVTDAKLEELKKQVESTLRAPDISDQDFLNMIVNYSKGDISESMFSPYICADRNIAVIVNGEKLIWAEFMSRADRKKLKVRSIHITRNQNNCVVALKMDVKGKFK